VGAISAEFQFKLDVDGKLLDGRSEGLATMRQGELFSKLLFLSMRGAAAGAVLNATGRLCGFWAGRGEGKVCKRGGCGRRSVSCQLSAFSFFLRNPDCG